MSRKRKACKRNIQPDPIYSSIDVSRFINKVMIKGKKSTAEKIAYSALERLGESANQEPLAAFKDAIQNVKPLMEVKSRRVGGSTYQVPVEVNNDRGTMLAMKWVVLHARKRKEKTMALRLALELKDAIDETGGSFKKKEESHKMAHANKAFAHFRW